MAARVRALAALAEELELVELEVRDGDQAVRLRRAVGEVLGVGAPAVPAAAATAPPAPAASGRTITAPLTGTFYRAAAPGEPPFVSPGQHVAVGDILCIIESMKMMNHIEAEAPGTVAAVLVEDGTAVDAGDPLFTLD